VLCHKEFFIFTSEDTNEEDRLKEIAEQSFSERGSSSEIEASAYSSEEIPGLPEDYDLDEPYEQDEGVTDVRTRQ